MFFRWKIENTCLKKKNKNIIYKYVYFVCYSHKQQDLQRLKAKLLFRFWISVLNG